MILHNTKLRLKTVSKLSKNIIQMAKNLGLYKNTENSTNSWSNEVIDILKTLKGEYNFVLNPTSKSKLTQSEEEKLKRDIDSLDPSTSSILKELFKELSQVIMNEVNTTYNNDDFIEKFDKELFCITNDNLKYLNEQLNSLTKNKVNITLEQLYSIQKIVFSLKKLDKKGITPKSYKSKLKSYKMFREKALDEFGIYMKKIPPFSNPTALYTDLDTRLTEAGLDKVQKREFYLWFHIRKRVPNQSATNSKVEKKVFENVVHNYNTLLYDEAQLATITQDENFTFNQFYSNLLEKYNLGEIPKSVSDYEIDNRNEQEEIAIENEIASWKLDSEQATHLDNIFLNHVLFEKELQKLLTNNNLPLLIKAIEKYKLHRYIEIDDNISDLHKETPSS